MSINVSAGSARRSAGRHRAETTGNPLARFIAGFVAMLLVCTALVAAATTQANAATRGVTASLTINGASYDGMKVLAPGQQLELKVQYDKSVEPGSTVAIELGNNVTLGALPEANTAIKSIEKDPSNPQRVLITFADPFPSNIDQGVLGLKFTMNKVDKSEVTQLEWSVDAEANAVDVIVKQPGDATMPTNTAQSKSIVGNANWNQYVSVKDGKVVIDEKILNNKVSYRLIVDHPKGLQGYTIEDQLPAGMTYVEDSFRSVSNRWDEHGLNKTSTNTAFAPSIEDNAFSATLDLPKFGTSEFYYQAKIDGAEGLAALTQALQASYDKIDPKAGGNYNTALKNTATFGGKVKKNASFSIGGSVAGEAGVSVGQAVGKSVSPDWDIVTPQADGTLDPVVPVTYSLKADLRQWDGTTDARQPLTKNVVLADALPKQAQWDTDDADFITADGIELTQATEAPANAMDFMDDRYVGQWALLNNTLLVNFGKSNKTNATVHAKAEIVTTVGLKNSNAWDHGAAFDQKLAFTNVASYLIAGQNVPTSAETTLLVQNDVQDGVNRPSSFSKTASPAQVTVKPGETATVNYKFVIEPEANVDGDTAAIVDYVDGNIFDLSDLQALRAGIKASYNWQAMSPSHFDLSIDKEGNLRIALNDEGKAAVAKAGLNKHFELTLPLTTKPVKASQTLNIVNKAVLKGEKDESVYWSEVTTEATSYGDEAEVRKSVRDADKREWTENLRASVKQDGSLERDTFVYRVSFVPHGGYNNVAIVPVKDVLPEGVTFLGFVNDDAVDTAAGASTATRNLSGNLQASFAAATEGAPSGTVTLSQRPGTVLPANTGAISVNLAVRVDSFTNDLPIANVIGGASATIVPTDGYPLTIAKVDSSDASKVITDPESRFEVLNEQGEVIAQDVFVSRGFLRVADAEGHERAVKVPAAGVYTVREIKAPAGYELSKDTVQVRVDEDGSSPLVKFYNDPTPTEPTVEPSEPTVDPTEPTVEPSEPTVDPTEPTVEPSEPTVEPSEPTVEPSEPTVEPTEPTGEVEPTTTTAPVDPTESQDPSTEPSGSVSPTTTAPSGDVEVGGQGSTRPVQSESSTAAAAKDDSQNPSSSEENDLANTGLPATFPLVALAAVILALVGAALMARGRMQRRH